ncbi:MAG: hypothetical protein WDM79_04610 [Terricaulis sp.]
MRTHPAQYSASETHLPLPARAAALVVSALAVSVVLFHVALTAAGIVA